jgi:secreted trypsin-like serine protease
MLGDSGGPIFVQVGSQQRIVATISDAGDMCTEEEAHARADTKYVQDWIKGTIAVIERSASGDAAARTMRLRSFAGEA